MARKIRSAAWRPMLEEARALGELLKQGWKPKRTIIYAAWDGEEPGLLGSTEWAEAARRRTAAASRRLHQLRRQRPRISRRRGLALARSISSTAWRATSTIRKRTSRVVEAAAGATASPRGTAERPQDARAAAPTCASARSARAPTTRRSCSTSASPSLNLGFGGEDDGGIYHSIYDDFYWYTHFSDYDFVYGRALAQTAGTTVMRWPTPTAAVRLHGSRRRGATYVDGSRRRCSRQRQDEIREKNRQIDDGVFAAMVDPRRPRSRRRRTRAARDQLRSAGERLRSSPRRQPATRRRARRRLEAEHV